MAKLIDRPQEQSPTENDTLVRETPDRVAPSTAPFVPEMPQDEVAAPSQPKRQIRWMHWLAGFVLLAAVAGLVMLAVGNDGSDPVTQVTPRSAVNGEVWAEPAIVNTQRSAVNGEVWAAAQTVTITTSRSALNGEVWAAAQTVTITTPRSALNGEVWAEPAIVTTSRSALNGEVWAEAAQTETVTLGPLVSADGAEGWIESTTSE